MRDKTTPLDAPITSDTSTLFLLSSYDSVGAAQIKVIKQSFYATLICVDMHNTSIKVLLVSNSLIHLVLYLHVS